jgi:glucan phosphoethanolaminetransferase (alkaline phosphatase superfamily)
LELAGISRSAAYPMGILLAIVILLFSWYLYSIIPPAIADLKTYARRFIKQYSKNTPRSKKIDMLWLFAFVAGCTFLLVRAPFPQRLRGIHEPLYAMVYGETQFMGMFHLAEYKEPASIRQFYPKNIPFNKKNVIIIIVDDLRAENMSLYGYTRPTSPFLQQLYQERKLQRVDYAFSTSAASFPGIFSILRSKPSFDLARTNFSISELLRDQGYKVNYILAGDHTNWYDMKYFYGKSIDLYYDGRQSERYVCDDLLLFEGLGKVKPYVDTPSFFYIHMMSVHYAGLKHPEFVKWTPAGIEEDSLPYRNNYDNGILQADNYISKIFQELKQKGYLDNSIVVITGDHGESLGERKTYGHVSNIYNEQIRIPLLIYDSDTTVRYDQKRDFAEQPDIAATIIDRLGLSIPASWRGTSLLRDSFTSYTYHSIDDSYAIIHYAGDKIYKYHYNPKEKKEALYELRSDIREQKNMLSSTDPAYVSTLRGRMDTFLVHHRNY